MKKKISNQFFIHYLVVFILVVMATVLAYFFLTLANHLVEGTYTKNKYLAKDMMRDDYHQIDATPIVQNGGSMQVVDKEYRVVLSEGKDVFSKKQLTPSEFTEFLIQSKSKGISFSHDIEYNPEGEFWLIITFPTSFRIDFGIIWNPEAGTGTFGIVLLAFATSIGMYLLLLSVISMIFSKINALQITRPLQKLCDGTRLLREGDYSVRVDLRLKNEFAELQDTFNDMAVRIEHEISLRKKLEEDRRRLILDISHDLKNPMFTIQGYAERLCQRTDMNEKERTGYLQIIYQNSQRANRLLNELFELSKMDAPDYSLKLMKADLCETLRQLCGELVPQLERFGFEYEFNIPEDSVFAMLDVGHFARIIHNLMDNAVRYNPEGTTLFVSLTVQCNWAVIEFGDDGIGIPTHLMQDIFKPFVRVDDSRNSETGGSGLGLSIAKKIAQAHGGDLSLCENGSKGCTFKFMIPTI